MPRVNVLRLWGERAESGCNKMSLGLLPSWPGYKDGIGLLPEEYEHTSHQMTGPHSLTQYVENRNHWGRFQGVLYTNKNKQHQHSRVYRALSTSFSHIYSMDSSHFQQW